MNRKFVLMVSLLLFPVFAYARASSKQIKLVDYFLKTPTKNLNPDLVPDFLAVGEKNLPRSLRQGYVSKVMELYALRDVARGKKEGLVRTPNDSSPSCREFHIRKGIRMYSSMFSKPLFQGKDIPGIIRLLHMAYFSEISSDYLPCVKKRTQCTQQDMVCDFTLTILSIKKGKRRAYRYFIYQNDPLGAVSSLCSHPSRRRFQLWEPRPRRNQ